MALILAAVGQFSSSDKTNEKESESKDNRMVSSSITNYTVYSNIYNDHDVYGYEVDIYKIAEQFSSEFSKMKAHLHGIAIYGEGVYDIITLLKDSTATSSGGLVASLPSLEYIKIFVPVQKVDQYVFAKTSSGLKMFFYGGIQEYGEGAFQESKSYIFTNVKDYPYISTSENWNRDSIYLGQGRNSSNTGGGGEPFYHVTVKDLPDKIQTNNAVPVHKWNTQIHKFGKNSFKDASISCVGNLFSYTKQNSSENPVYGNEIGDEAFYNTQIVFSYMDYHGNNNYSSGSRGGGTPHGQAYDDWHWNGTLCILNETLSNNAFYNFTVTWGPQKRLVYYLPKIKKLGKYSLAFCDMADDYRSRFYLNSSLNSIDQYCFSQKTDSLETKIGLYKFTNETDTSTNSLFALDLETLVYLGDYGLNNCQLTTKDVTKRQDKIVDFQCLESIGISPFENGTLSNTANIKGFIFPKKETTVSLSKGALIPFTQNNYLELHNINLTMSDNIFARDSALQSEYFTYKGSGRYLIGEQSQSQRTNSFEYMFGSSDYPKKFELIQITDDETNLRETFGESNYAINLSNTTEIKDFQINAAVVFSTCSDTSNMSTINITAMKFSNWNVWRETWEWSALYSYNNENTIIKQNNNTYILGTLSYRQCPNSNITYYVNNTQLPKTGLSIKISETGNISVPFARGGYSEMVIDYDIDDPSDDTKKISYIPWPIMDSGVSNISNYLDMNDRWNAKQIILHNLEAGVSIYRDDLVCDNGKIISFKPSECHWLRLFKPHNITINSPFVIKITNDFSGVLPRGALNTLSYSNFITGIEGNTDQSLAFDESNNSPTVYLLLPNTLTAISIGALGLIDVTIRDNNYDTSIPNSTEHLLDTSKIIYWDEGNFIELTNDVSQLTNLDLTNKKIVEAQGGKMLYFKSNGVREIVLKDLRTGPTSLNLANQNNLVIAKGAFNGNSIRDITVSWIGASPFIYQNNFKTAADNYTQLKYIFNQDTLATTSIYNITIIQTYPIYTSETYPVLDKFFKFSHLHFIGNSSGSDQALQELGAAQFLFGVSDDNNDYTNDKKPIIKITNITFEHCPIPKYLFSKKLGEKFAINANGEYLNINLIGDRVTSLPEESFYAIQNIGNLVLPHNLLEIDNCFNKGVNINLVKYPHSAEHWGVTVTVIDKQSTNPMSFCRRFLVKENTQSNNYVPLVHLKNFEPNSRIKALAYANNYLINSVNLENVVALGSQAFYNNYVLYEIYNVSDAIYDSLDMENKLKVKSTTSDSKTEVEV